MFLDDGIGDEDEKDDDAVGDRESDWRATSLDVNSAGHQIKETASDDSAGGWDRVQFEFLPTFQTAHCAVQEGGTEARYCLEFNTPCLKRT